MVYYIEDKSVSDYLVILHIFFYYIVKKLCRITKSDFL